MELADVNNHPLALQYPTRTPVWWARIGTSEKSINSVGVSGRRVVLRIEKRFNRFTSSIDTAKNNAANATYYGLFLGVFCIVLLFAVSLPIAKAIVHNIQNVVASLKDIAQGDGDLRVL